MTEDLSRAMRVTAENLHPNIGALTAGGIQRGVKKRRVRRISQIAGAAAGVTAVFGVVAVVAPGGGSARPVGPAAGFTPAVVSTTSAAAPTVTDMSGEDAVKLLQQELAPYGFTDESVVSKSGTTDIGDVTATLTVGYSSGKGGVSIVVDRSAWSDQHINGTLPYTTVTQLTDGSHLMVYNGPMWPQGNGDPKDLRLDVSWYRTDGSRVAIDAINQVQEKGAPTATTLPLTVDQAAKLAQSPAWAQAIAAVLSQPKPSERKHAPVPANSSALDRSVLNNPVTTTGNPGH